uniref:Uncharacterized protein n=1 Tax=Arundo donax TaxID=35708 RepID=A0A0A8ZGP7_ARUDO
MAFLVLSSSSSRGKSKLLQLLVLQRL